MPGPPDYSKLSVTQLAKLDMSKPNNRKFKDAEKAGKYYHSLFLLLIIFSIDVH